MYGSPEIRDPTEVQLLKKMFGDMSLANEAIHRFELCVKTPFYHIRSKETITMSNFPEYLKDRFRLDEYDAQIVHIYLILTRIAKKKPKEAIHEVADGVEKGKFKGVNYKLDNFF